MLTSITPLGERSRNRSWPTTVSAYVAGSLIGGGVTGLVAGSLGSLLPGSLRIDKSLWIVALVLVLVAVSELGLFRIPAIGRRQVNENWLDEYRGWVIGFGFGFQLGLGVATIVTSLAVPATFVLAFLTLSPGWGLLIGATFGVARALPILRTSRVRDAASLAELHRSHDRSARSVSVSLAVAIAPLVILAVVA